MDDSNKNILKGGPGAESSEPAPKKEESDLMDEETETRALDQLGTPGSLEVEDMPESNELQERRRKTKSRLTELANTTEPENKAFEDEEAGLMDLLREANLTGRHFRFCCGGILVLALLVGMFFGAKALWAWWKQRPEDEQEPEEEEIVEEPEEEYDYADPSLLAGIMVGEEVAEEDEATGAGENLGVTGTSSDPFTQSILDFAALYESMQVDVNELLAQSTDRRGTLEDYVNELNYLIYLGKQNVEQLETESSNLADQFEAAEGDKDTSETKFFAEMSALDAYGAAAALDSFIEDGETVVRLRAEYNARQKLLDYFEQVLESAELRLTDIELNEEALVKGVQVVDIEGSDLNLILDENDL